MSETGGNTFSKFLIPALLLAGLIGLFFLFSSMQWFTPEHVIQTRSGNGAYDKEEFVDAQVDYKKALESQSDYSEARYNLGNALYKQERFEEAGKEYRQAAELGWDEGHSADAYHNQGNALLKEKKFKEAIKAFKKAVSYNPLDPESRYNLAYALQMLQNNPDQQNDDDKVEPSEFAKKLKAQADELVNQRKYQDAFQLMQGGLQKDKTVSHYNDYIGRLQEVSGVKSE
ncbi:MAG: tetratricopeptide repeat protein [Bacteroidota bacterium]